MNIYINELLNLIPGVKVYADDLILAQDYVPWEEAATTTQMNAMLSRILSWGNKWQVKLTSNKMHLLIVSRARTDLWLALRGETLVS